MKVNVTHGIGGHLHDEVSALMAKCIAREVVVFMSSEM